VIAFLVSGALSCSPAVNPPPRNTDFDFIFKYGVGPPVNALDTFQGTCTKDMVMDSSITINLFLTQEEMDTIQSKMKAIDFFNYPYDFNSRIPSGQIRGYVVPPTVYHFKVKDGPVWKEVIWNSGVVYQDDQAADLKGLVDLIIGIIESKDEYKKLPRPRSAYL